ncbi:MAG: aminotransferase DegT [Lachnospiraceae bacterium]|nr:aminotransferase DegT [Lachnospiraceae bacterium]
MDFKIDSRFKGIEPFPHKIWLSSPTMHGEELQYVTEAYKTNWMSTVGENINELEVAVAQRVGVKYAIALSSGTAALHLAVKLAAKHLYNSSTGISTPDRLGSGGSLYGRRVFCSDLTFDATVNPILYEGGEAIFIDTEPETWNMDPDALEKAFCLYPDVKLVVMAHLYGTPGKFDELKSICEKHQALIIEDAAESLGASYKEIQTGALGDFNVISFNGNKIITGSSGGMFLTNSLEDMEKCRKWSTQSREAASWYQHEELGYNYRMSNVIAGVVRGQIPYLEEHIAQKKKIYERYKEGLSDLPVAMNPYDKNNSVPNFWLSCMVIDELAMCRQVRGEQDASYIHCAGKTCPTEILETLTAFNIEGRPIWKPMHMQPIYRNHVFVTRDGFGRGLSNAYINKEDKPDTGADIFQRGLCLPSDNKMTAKEQDVVIDLIHRCFQ